MPSCEPHLVLPLGPLGRELLRMNSSRVWDFSLSWGFSLSIWKEVVSQLPLSLLWNLCRKHATPQSMLSHHT